MYRQKSQGDAFMKEATTYHIRPAGRHILTIGRDLIQDKCAAIMELVKNAYDADSRDVHISIKASNDGKKLITKIEDHGHGMSRDTVIDKWLVPSTDDKLKKLTSPKGRIMQGRKGVGRYAASILGDDMLLETVTESGHKTAVYVQWKDFESAKYLDDVEISVKTQKTDDKHGTTLTITGNQKHLDEWDEKQVKNLRFQLRKMIPPVNIQANKDTFKITLTIAGLAGGQIASFTEEVEPYQIIQYFDYSISGSINPEGKGNLLYVNQKARNTPKETIEFDLGGPTKCGALDFNIMVYDREKDAIEKLIKRGLKDERTGEYLGNLQARRLLDDYNGIGVYRNGFRIRPLGDADFDWLKLNEQRVQNPSVRIGSNQVIGYVKIQSEEVSGLEEKSARDGLRENEAYQQLKNISNKVISELENRRFEYRKKAGLGRTSLKVEQELERLFSFEEVRKSIRHRLKKSGVDEKTTQEIIKIITKEEEDKNHIADEIRQTVAIYQGQATLGKIINVVLHEGRKPLDFFKNQISNMFFWAGELKKQYEQQILDTIIRTTENFGNNADMLVHLYKRLDPLAPRGRANRKLFSIKEAVSGAFEVFENEFTDKGITYQVTGDDKIQIDGWYQDIYVIMTNLIDNSIYWMVEKKSPRKKITVEISCANNHFDFFDYRDTGPGIESHLIESGVIFEPEFSTKILSDGTRGTGLGLAISGEAATRNDLELKAFASESGAYFRLQKKGEEQNV
jgi:signal transduction histidine kinase